MPVLRIAVRILACSAMLFGLVEFHTASAFGQVSPVSSQTAQLTVTVTDSAGAVIPNADVAVNGQKSVSTKTLQDGMARVPLLFGSYDITVTSPGFKAAKFIKFPVATARPYLDVVLHLPRCYHCGEGGVPTITSDVSNVIEPNEDVQMHLGSGPMKLVFVSTPSDCPKNQPKTEAALLDLERHWADALTHKDVDAVACILADEFQDADVDGSVHSRTEALAKIPQRKPWTNRLTEMRAHVEANSGFARGLNEILDADGKVVARVRFTDIFTYRDGRWQALAGHESLVGEAHR